MVGTDVSECEGRGWRPRRGPGYRESVPDAKDGPLKPQREAKQGHTGIKGLWRKPLQLPREGEGGDGGKQSGKRATAMTGRVQGGADLSVQEAESVNLKPEGFWG